MPPKTLADFRAELAAKTGGRPARLIPDPDSLQLAEDHAEPVPPDNASKMEENDK